MSIPDGAKNIEVLEEILRQGLDLRRKQDTRLANEQRRSTVLAGAFITVTALVFTLLTSPTVSASSPLILITGIITLTIIVVNGICWFLTHSVPVNWHEGPNTNELIHNFAARYDGYRAMLLHLVNLHDDHRCRNEELLDHVRSCFGLQATVNFIAIGVLIGVVLALG